MTIEPDAALLWARRKVALAYAGEASASFVAEMETGGNDNWVVLVTAEAFRAGQSHAAGLLEALAGPMAWLDGWAQHVGNCQGGYFCTCGLTAARSELSAAIAAAKGADK